MPPLLPPPPPVRRCRAPAHPVLLSQLFVNASPVLATSLARCHPSLPSLPPAGMPHRCLLALAATALLLLALGPQHASACTSYIVGAAASTDGSVLIARNDDGEVGRGPLAAARRAPSFTIPAAAPPTGRASSRRAVRPVHPPTHCTRLPAPSPLPPGRRISQLAGLPPAARGARPLGRQPQQPVSGAARPRAGVFRAARGAACRRVGAQHQVWERGGAGRQAPRAKNVRDKYCWMTRSLWQSTDSPVHSLEMPTPAPHPPTVLQR